MTRLVRLFAADLVRRRFLWAIVAVMLGSVAVQYGAFNAFGDSLGSGESWDLASRRAGSRIDEIAGSMRSWLAVLVVLVGAQLAPETRKNGTLQFVLSLGVGRKKAAAAQLLALFLFLLATAFVIHAGFGVAGIRTGALQPREIGLAWITLVVPLLGLAMAVFAVSLTASAIETYLLFLAVPFIVRTVPTTIMRGFPKGTPRLLAHVMDNVGLFFPDAGELMTWPHLAYGKIEGPILPDARYAALHFAIATAFWTVLGVWRFLRYDLGSRTALK